jgi:hypothetical protein
MLDVYEHRGRTKKIYKYKIRKIFENLIKEVIEIGRHLATDIKRRK